MIKGLEAATVYLHMMFILDGIGGLKNYKKQESKRAFAVMFGMKIIEMHQHLKMLKAKGLVFSKGKNVYFKSIHKNIIKNKPESKEKDGKYYMEDIREFLIDLLEDQKPVIIKKCLKKQVCQKKSYELYYKTMRV